MKHSPGLEAADWQTMDVTQMTFYDGQELLIAVPLASGSYDYAVIMIREDGLELNGEPYEDWDLSDVDCFVWIKR